MMNHNINIEDISQKVFSGDVFTMTMMADISKSNLALNEVASRIDEALEGMGLQVTVHDAELFQYMHRV